MVEPELLPNGDILVPVTNPDGSQSTVRLEPGDSEHTAWLERIQRGRRSAHPPPPPPPPSSKSRGGANEPPPPSPTRGRRFPWKSTVAVVAGVIGVLWFAGLLDRVLYPLGLNYNECARNVLGATFCGDELEQVRERVEEVSPAIEDEPVDEEEATTSDTRTDVGETAADDGLSFKVTRIEAVDSIPIPYSAAATARSGRQLVRVDLTYRNESRKPHDYLCQVTAGGSGAQLVDTSDRVYTPHDSVFEIKGNAEACGRGVQPGLTDHAVIPFELPENASVAGVRLWDPEGADLDYGTEPESAVFVNAR
jgi:hypothetical protein